MKTLQQVQADLKHQLSLNDGSSASNGDQRQFRNAISKMEDTSKMNLGYSHFQARDFGTGANGMLEENVSFVENEYVASSAEQTIEECIDVINGILRLDQNSILEDKPYILKELKKHQVKLSKLINELEK